MEEIVKQYQEWKAKHPDEGYQYDEIHGFVNELSRGDLQSLMEYVEQQVTQTT